MPQIKINGVEHIIDADPQMPLLWVIRDIIGLTGTKFGSGVGACGARTVLFDGEAVRPCLRSLADAQGHEVVTIEGLSADRGRPVQRAWEANKCSAVRLLPGGPDHAGRRLAQTDTAHGGRLGASPNVPYGSVFRFTVSVTVERN